MKKLIFLFFIFSSFSFSHKINIFTYKEGRKIFVEGYFTDGTPAKNSLIQVYNEKGEKIIEGKTNAEGIFSFDIPNCKNIKIFLTGDAGHKISTEMELKKEIKSEKIEKRKDEKVNTKIDEEKLKEIVEESIEKEIVILMKEIEKEKQKIRISDIIGGIGYIIGIFGIYCYLKGRR